MEEGTAETVKAELCIFEALPYQVTHIQADWNRHDTKNNCLGTNTDTPIIFNIPKSAGLYIDFNDSFVDMELAIEASGLAGNEKVSFCNFPMHTLFQDISFSINNTKIEGENQHYAYKAYIYIYIH